MTMILLVFIGLAVTAAAEGQADYPQGGYSNPCTIDPNYILAPNPMEAQYPVFNPNHFMVWTDYPAREGWVRTSPELRERRVDSMTGFQYTQCYVFVQDVQMIGQFQGYTSGWVASERGLYFSNETVNRTWFQYRPVAPPRRIDTRQVPGWI